MKFTVSQASLNEALGIVAKGVSGTSTLPLLSGVLIKAYDGILELHTSNLNISIRHRIAAHVEDAGEVVIPCKMLAGIVKTLPDATITFETDVHQILLKCEKSQFKLNILPATDFPEFPTVIPEKSVELPCDILSEMVARVYRVTSNDKNRPTLTGVYTTVENNMIRLVATDSYRLAVCDTQAETSSLDGSFELNIPAAAFNDALSITGGKGSVVIGSTDTQVMFVTGNTTYISRRIEGNYPNYKQLIPASCTTRVRIDADKLSQALKRVSVVAQNNSAVKFEINAEDATLTLYALSNDQDAASETIEVEVEGESGVIAFNYHYINDCLITLKGDKELSLELQSYAQAGVFKSYSKINYLYLVMPVRI